LIREALLVDLPRAFEPPKRPDKSKATIHRWIKVFAILAAVYLMAGWTITPGHWFGWAICFGLVADIVTRQNAGKGRRGLNAVQYALVFIVSGAAAALFSFWFFDVKPTDGYTFLLLGYCIANVVDEGAVADQSSRACGALLRAINVPISYDPGGTGKAASFQPHWPFRSQIDETVWAIDPANRAVRLMLPALQDVDVVFVWDEPIRAVELRRIRRSSWAVFWRGASPLPDSRELEVLSGRDHASAWGFVFHFYGLDKDAAKHWHETFQQWMRDDKAAGFA